MIELNYSTIWKNKIAVFRVCDIKTAFHVSLKKKHNNTSINNRIIDILTGLPHNHKLSSLKSDDRRVNAHALATAAHAPISP